MIKSVKTITNIFICLFIFIILFIMFKFKIYLFCPIHKLTGLYCPGCGVTRMIISIFNLNFYQAFRYNPFVFILLPFVIFYIIDIFISKIKNTRPISFKVSNYIYYILAILLIIYGIIRNIPFFDYLKPTLIK